MKINKQTKIGFMITVVFVILIAMHLKAGRFKFSKDTYNIKVLFDDISGVNTNSPVMFNGYEVGIVEDIKIVDGKDGIKIELDLQLNETAKLRKSSKAYIKNLGFMGEKYVGLTAGKKGEPYLSEGATIVGKEPPDMEKLLAKGDEIADNVKEITQNLNERLKNNSKNVDEILANLNKTSENISSITSNVDESLKSNEEKIDKMIANLNIVSFNLEELSYDLKENPWKLLYRPKKARKK